MEDESKSTMKTTNIMKIIVGTFTSTIKQKFLWSKIEQFLDQAKKCQKFYHKVIKVLYSNFRYVNDNNYIHYFIRFN